jgi:bifunctional non-homologous end joining protein LigD
MLARNNPYEEPFKQNNYVLQEKYDGSRIIVVRKGNSLHLMSGRSWKTDFTGNYPEIVTELQRIPSNDYVLDGELVFFKNGRPMFLNASAKDNTKVGLVAKLMVFDVLRYNRDTTKLPFAQRNLLLLKIIPKGLKYVEVIKTHTDIKQFNGIYKDVIKKKGEGVILKEKNSIYIPDSRQHWVKVKKTDTEDCVVLGITTETGVRAATFGALILAQYNKNGQLVRIGNCSGFDNATHMQLYNQIMHMQEMHYPQISYNGVKRTVVPKIVVEVKFLEKTPDGMLRMPSFVRMRPDKNPKMCVISA